MKKTLIKDLFLCVVFLVIISTIILLYVYGNPEIQKIILFRSVPGIGGGIVSITYGLKMGYYKNDRILNKALIEVIGATITPTFVSSMFDYETYLFFVSFAIGFSWSKIMQVIRQKITKLLGKC